MKNERAILIAVNIFECRYRLGTTKPGVLLLCTFDGAITISSLSNCTHSDLSELPYGVMLALPKLSVGTIQTTLHYPDVLLVNRLVLGSRGLAAHPGVGT